MTGAAYRATVEGSGSETVAKCRCICYLRSPAMVWTEEGPCCPIQHDYLLLGLEVSLPAFMQWLSEYIVRALLFVEQSASCYNYIYESNTTVTLRYFMPYEKVLHKLCQYNVVYSHSIGMYIHWGGSQKQRAPTKTDAQEIRISRPLISEPNF